MSHPCSRVGLSWKTPRQRVTLSAGWAIIIPPPKRGRSQIPRSPYIAPFSLSLPLLFLLLSPPLSWIAHQTRHVVILSPCLGSERYSPVSCLGNASSFSQNSSTPPDHLLATGGRNYLPQSTPTRSFTVRHSLPLLLCKCRVNRRIIPGAIRSLATGQ
ncbi:hypothetical protein BJV74DRAFT_444732 [Russula compacta]|nr:hypothetical protein BJV74DRAFT_444732 [Russula compacta]